MSTALFPAVIILSVWLFGCSIGYQLRQRHLEENIHHLTNELIVAAKAKRSDEMNFVKLDEKIDGLERLLVNDKV